MINDGSPVRLKLRAQIVRATSKMAPSPYSRCEGVSFTGLPHKDELARRLAAIRRTSLPSSAPSPERATVPEPAESSAPPSLTMTSATRSEGRSASTRPMACALLRSEEHTSELQSRGHLVCRLLLEKKKQTQRL